MTVACVLRSGGIYTVEWVRRLHAQVARHVAIPFRFAVLSDVWHEMLPSPDHWDVIPLIQDWPGWWAKMELFRPLPWSGPVLYLDLDTLVLGDLYPLASYSGHFATLTDFYEPGMAASGVMLWDGANPPALYRRALAEERFPPRYGGRSDLWWGQHAAPDRLQDLYPGFFGSFKADELHNDPGEFKVVCFHGVPKMADAGGWAAEVWRSAA